MGKKHPAQKAVDAKIVKAKGAVLDDTPGGVDEAKASTYKTHKGIRLHDKDEDTWGLTKVPRYEHD